MAEDVRAWIRAEREQLQTKLAYLAELEGRLGSNSGAAPVRRGRKPGKAGRKTRNTSPETRALQSEAAKKRWAAAKKAGRNRLGPAPLDVAADVEAQMKGQKGSRRRKVR